LLFSKEEGAIGWVDIPKQDDIAESDLEKLRDFNEEVVDK